MPAAILAWRGALSKVLVAFTRHILAAEKAELGSAFAGHHVALLENLPCLQLALGARLPQNAPHFLLTARTSSCVPYVCA